MSLRARIYFAEMSSSKYMQKVCRTCGGTFNSRHWSVGFINFPVFVVLIERRPMVADLSLHYTSETRDKANAN